jgi:outer membrane murein-binding lipoprotein Lpp
LLSEVAALLSEVDALDAEVAALLSDVDALDAEVEANPA